MIARRHDDTRVSALIAAAGDGTRLGRGPKAFLQLDGETLLERVLRTARAVAGEVVIAAPPSALARTRALAGDAIVVAGGAHRSDSFRAALQASQGALLLLLDVSRPFVSAALARAVLDAARRDGAAGAFVAADVPVAVADGTRIVDHLPAAGLRLPQMPQAFARAVLERVLSPCDDPPQTVWELALRRGVALAAVPGEPTNLKITTPLDWAMAQQVIDPLLHATGSA